MCNLDVWKRFKLGWPVSRDPRSNKQVWHVGAFVISHEFETQLFSGLLRFLRIGDNPFLLNKDGSIYAYSIIPTLSPESFSNFSVRVSKLMEKGSYLRSLQGIRKIFEGLVLK